MAVPARKPPTSPQLRLITAVRDELTGWSESPRSGTWSRPSDAEALNDAEARSDAARSDADARSDAEARKDGAEAPKDEPSPQDFLPWGQGHGGLRQEQARSQADLSDAQLVALARVGERQAFELLYRRHAPYVLSLTVRMQGNAADAEDVVHDAFMKVHSRLSELRNEDSFRFWLSKVASNLVRSRMRRRRLLGALGLHEGEPIDLDALVTPEAGPEERVQLAQVYETLGEVPVDQRLAWILRHVEGHKLEEVARLCGCSLATAKRWIAAVQERVSLHGIRGASS